MAMSKDAITLKTYMVLFRSGAGMSCEAENQAAAVQLAKADQRALGRTKRELKVERTWEDDGTRPPPPSKR